MALKQGTSDEVIGENVTTLVNEGCTLGDATMKAYKSAGRSSMECSLASAAAEQQDPAHAVPVASNGFRAAAERPVGRIAR